MVFKTLTVAACAVAVLAAPASALTFNITTAPGATLTADQSAAFAAAASAWSSILIDKVTINLEVGFSSTLGDGVLGSTSLSTVSVARNSVVAALSADAKSANDAQAVSSLLSLPPANPTISLTSAEAKALGYGVGGGVDAIIEFSSSYDFATSRNADGSTPQNAYDLTGVAEHEIGHALGFVSSYDSGGAATLLDEFRYTARTVRATTAGSAYFSLDGGTSDIATFSPGGSGQYQASHWLQGTGGLMDPAVATGVTKAITALDIEALDVLGYDVAVPEPATFAILLVGITGAAGLRRQALAARA